MEKKKKKRLRPHLNCVDKKQLICLGDSTHVVFEIRRSGCNRTARQNLIINNAGNLLFLTVQLISYK